MTQPPLMPKILLEKHTHFSVMCEFREQPEQKFHYQHLYLKAREWYRAKRKYNGISPSGQQTRSMEETLN